MDSIQISLNCNFLTNKTKTPCKLNILKSKFLIIPFEGINKISTIIKFDNLNKIFIDIRQRKVSFFTPKEVFEFSEIKKIKFIEDFIKETIINNYPNCIVKIDKIKHNNKERKKHRKKIFSSFPKEAYLFLILLIVVTLFFISNFSSIRYK